MNDLISRQAAIEALECKKDKNAKGDIGVFIPGMRMPECCEECIMCNCNFNDYKYDETIDDYICLLEFKFIGSDHKKEDGRRDFCPLKEIKA